MMKMRRQSGRLGQMGESLRWTVLRIGLVVALASAPVVATRSAAALVWPDVAERVERDLTSADPVTRRAAARALRSLGPARGARLAVAALTDPDDDVRLAAAEAAIRLRAAGATDVVTPWLNASDVRLRREACEVARALPNPRAIAPLSRTLGDPDSEVRAAAAAALGRQASVEAVAPLLGRLDDATPGVRIEVVGGLARLGDPRAVVPLVGKVQDSSPEVRQAVVRALGDLDDLRASSALVLALRDQSVEVRRDALGALGRMQAADAVDAIAPFARDRAPALRTAALGALGRIGTPDAVRVLIAALGSGDDGGGALEATPVRDALVTAGVDRAVPALHALLASSPSPQAATSAGWILGALHARAEAPSIVAAMRRGTLPTAAALRALAGAGSDQDVPVVLEFVADPSPLVRGEAIAAATALLDPRRPDGRAVEPLAAALRDLRPPAPERAGLATLLGRTGAPRAAPLLVDLARTKDVALRTAAIDALGTLGAATGGAADETLLEAMGAADAGVRLHASIAMSLAGSARARDLLLGNLARGEELDRAALLTALGGILARAPSDEAVAALASALELTAGPERDALVDAIGLAPSASAMRALDGVAGSREPADRRAVAAMSAARKREGEPGAVAIVRSLLGDVDATVRAEAAWSLGTLGDDSDRGRLEALAHDADFDTASNAVAALGRISSRAVAGGPEAARSNVGVVLCPLVDGPRAYVRANALAGLALAGARCGDGARERAALIGDPSEDVRAAAALAVRSHADAEDARALARCKRSDASGAVAARCRSGDTARTTRTDATHSVLVYVVPEGAETPLPGASYAILLADGMVHSGTTDRRGAVFDPVAPEGEIALRRPSALAR